MTISSLLYISDARVTFDRQVAAIVERSRVWNARVGITGTLVHTDRHFVQFIEGTAGIVDDLLSKLACDGRHANMRIIQAATGRERQFRTWSLAYAGPDDFIDNRLVDLVTMDAGRSAVARDLTSALVGMASHR